MPLAHLWCQKLVPKCLKFLCFLPVCSHARLSCMHGHTCTYAHVHMCGGHPQPPYPHKKFEGPNSIGSRDMAHYVIGCKTSNFLIKVWGGGGGVCLASDPPTTTPKLQLDFKSKKSSCSLGVVVGGGGSEHHFNQFWHILHLRGWLTYVFTFHVTT